MELSYIVKFTADLGFIHSCCLWLCEREVLRHLEISFLVPSCGFDCHPGRFFTSRSICVASLTTGGWRRPPLCSGRACSFRSCSLPGRPSRLPHRAFRTFPARGPAP